MLGALSRIYDPGSIFHPLYLTSALAIAVAWLCARGTGIGGAFRLLFARDVWVRRSTLTDLLYCAGYLLLLRSAIGPLENSAFLAALGLGQRALAAAPVAAAPAAAQAAPGAPHLLSLACEGALATLVTMLAIDFASYGVHRLLHWRPVFGRIHRIHHSAERLTPLTTYRQHPLEPLLLYGARGLASGLGLAVLYHFLPRQTPVITIWGLGAGFFAYMFTVNLHHLSVPVRYPRLLRAVLVSPHLHQLHHSREPGHQGSNYGVVFSFWDRLFGTYLDEECEPGELRFGLGA